MSAPRVAGSPAPLAAPVLRISLSALRANAALLAARDIRATADLRRDARGHGLERVGRALVAAGLRRAVLDRVDRDAALGIGLEHAEPPATLDLDLLLGLPGRGGIPVSTLVSAVATTKSLRAGEGVSYGLTYRAQRETRVALVPGGYSHGIVRALGNAAEVAIHGRRLPIVGRVAMDVLVVDLGDSDVVPGAPVVLLGDAQRDEPSLTDWARVTGLSAAELLTAVALRCATEDAE